VLGFAFVGAICDRPRADVGIRPYGYYRGAHAKMEKGRKKTEEKSPESKIHH